MYIKAIIWKQKFSDIDKNFLNKILLAADIEKYEVINTYYYSVENESDTFYITFGGPAADQIQSKNKIEFPDISNLTNIKGNEKYREQAFKLLEAIKTRLNTNKITEIKSLPINTVEELIKINKYAIENNLDSIELLDSNNEKINIIFEKTNLPGKNILFSELIAIKLAMEIFNIKSIG